MIILLQYYNNTIIVIILVSPPRAFEFFELPAGDGAGMLADQRFGGPVTLPGRSI